MSNKVKYDCSRQEFYIAGHTILTSLARNYQDFTDYSPEYTPQRRADIKQLFDDAKALPTEEQRDLAIELQVIALRKNSDIATRYMQTLKNYMVKTWPLRQEHKPRLKAAGFDFYKKAANHDWEANTQMLDLANSFVADNASALAAKMPSAFPGKLTTATNDFIKTHSDLLKLRQDRPSLVSAKNKAENKAFDAIMAVCTDGKDIYKHDETRRAGFTWDSVVKLSGGEHQTGFKGHILDNVTGFGIPNVKLTSTDGKYTTETNPEGHFDFKQITGGTHKFTIEKDGYISQLIEITLETGVTKTVTYKLIKA